MLKKTTGPTALTTAAADILRGGGGTAGLQDTITHIHVVNKTSSDATFTAYIGATGAEAAGTELFVAKKVLANDVYDYYCEHDIDTTKYLVMKASANTTLVVAVDHVRRAV